MNIVVVSGGFDPIHSGHISYMKSAKDIGDHLLNSNREASYLAALCQGVHFHGKNESFNAKAARDPGQTRGRQTKGGPRDDGAL